MIAIVDDDEFVCESTKVLIESLGYEAVTFSSAEDFLQSLQLYTASCLITDVQMPGQSGLDLLEHLTRRGFEIPTIVVSGFLDEKNRARALKAGALGCLAKPYRAESFIKYLEMALGYGESRPDVRIFKSNGPSSGPAGGRAMADQVQWHLSGDYFENCSCSVVCPCLVSKAAPLTSRPTEGVCNVPVIFHIESGRYGSIALDGLNVALAIQTPGPMADGNWSVAAYIDQRADDKQTEALGAIFTGAAGGPMAAFAPLIGKNLGMKKVPITFRIEGKKRSAEIPGILHMSVDPLPTAHPSGEMWANTGHPISPERLAFAVGAPGNTFIDHGMRWDNSGKNGHYAPIRWSNQP